MEHTTQQYNILYIYHIILQSNTFEYLKVSSDSRKKNFVDHEHVELLSSIENVIRYTHLYIFGLEIAREFEIIKNFGSHMTIFCLLLLVLQS